MFGAAAVPASSGGEADTVVCTSPAHSPAETVEVRLELNGALHASLAPLRFVYYPPLAVSRTSTQVLPIEGGRPLTVYGAGFSSLANHSSLPATLLLLGTASVDSGELVLARRGEMHARGSAWLLPRWPHAPLGRFVLSMEALLGGRGNSEGLSIRYGPPSLRGFNAQGATCIEADYSFHMGAGAPRTCEEVDGVAGLVVSMRTGSHQRVEARLDGKIFASAYVAPHLRASTFGPLMLSVHPQRGLTLTWRHVELLSNAPMPPAWPSAPRRHWRIGLGASTDGQSAHHRIKSIRLASPLLRPRSAARVSVSGNGGSDFAAGGPHVAHVNPPLAQTFRPRVGPMHGGTLVRLALTHDDQLWYPAALPPFTYYAPPRWPSGVVPIGGPVRGGTAIELYGGDAARAAFAIVAAADGLLEVACAFGSAIVRATASMADGALRCTAPPAPAAGDASVRISLNGQQFHDLMPPAETAHEAPHEALTAGAPLAAHTARFAYYNPAPPFEIHPPQGPPDGATNVSLRGIGLEGGVGYVCQLGYARVPATYAPADGRVYCASPNADLALAPPDAGITRQQSYYGDVSTERSTDGAIRLTFAQVPPGDAEARNYVSNASTVAAVADAAALGIALTLEGGAGVRGGALRLTDSFHPQHEMWGGARMRVTLPRPPLRHLSVSCDLMMTGPDGGTPRADYPYGVTLSFGGPAHPLALAALGAPHGAVPATSTDEGGVRVLLGYGARRDVGVTNESVATYVRVVHVPSAGGPILDMMQWLPEVALPSASWRRVQLVCRRGLLHLWLDGARLLGGVALDGWQPAVEWAVGVHGSRGVSFHVHWVDNLQIASGALRTHAEVPVKLSRNGQQFDSVGVHTFGYRAPPVVSSVVPHAGAAWGNTSIILRGSNFAGGSAYRCFFDTAVDDVAAADEQAATTFRRIDARFEEVYAWWSGVWVPATYNPYNETVHCTAPPRKGGVPSGVLPMNLSLSLNGLEAGVNIPFEYVNASDLHVYPSLGPVDGGIYVAVRGVALDAGHDRQCRFGMRGAADTPWPGGLLKGARAEREGHAAGEEKLDGTYPSEYLTVVDGDHRTNATLRASDKALICVTPPAAEVGWPINATSGGAVPLQLSLNGQDGTFAQVALSFVYYPNPVISRVHPIAGPSAGGTAVTLFGRGFGGSSPRLQCRFGRAIILAAPNATDEWMVCVTPRAPVAAAAVDLTLADCIPAGAATREDAAPHSAGTDTLDGSSGSGTSGGLIALTRLGSFDVEGSCLWADLTPRYHAHCADTPPYPDPFVQNCTSADALYDAAFFFAASLELHLTDGGEGLTFEYGRLPRVPLHAPRVRMGLRVELRTRHNDSHGRELAVAYDDVPLVRVAVPPLPPSTASSSSAAAFVPFLIAYDRVSHGGPYAGLTVMHAGHSLVRGMHIHRWHPRSHWRFRLSAKTGVGHADALVRGLRLRGGGHDEAQQTPLHVTRNDQDFDMSRTPERFVYYGAPIISTLAPGSGPTVGGTRVRVAGEALVGGSAYHCRFGDVTRHDYHGRGSAAVLPPEHARLVLPDLNTTHAAPFVHCTAPPFPAGATTLTPQIALNRQDETTSGVPFRYYDPPGLDALSPTSGPSLGGTRIELYGANFSSALLANATNATSGETFLQAWDPRVAPLVVCRFGGAMWPRRHGYLSVLTRTNAIAGPHRVAERPTHGLAPNEVFATVVNDSLAVCISPPSVGGQQDDVHLELSLNGHDFTFGGDTLYRFYDERPRVSSVFPTTDSSLGGRLLTLRGVGLANGSHPLCQFRASPMLAAVGMRELGVGGLTFRTQYIPASVRDEGRTLACVSPALPAGSPLAAAEVPVVFPLELRVSLNAQQYTAAPSGAMASAPLDFGISAGGGGSEGGLGDTTPRLLDVRPALGPINGSTYVRVSGLLLGYGSLYLCRFGTSVVPASYDRLEGSVFCYTPPHLAATVPLAVSFNGEHYEAETFDWTFHHELALHEVSPASGPAYGVQCADDMRCPGGTSLGTLVTISGGHLAGGAPPLFPTSAALDLHRCRFEATVVPATLVSINHTAHVILCHAPGSVRAGTPAALTVSLNAQDYSMAHLVFTYQQPEITTRLAPALGPSLGGTNVTIVGGGLGGGSHYLCRFGDLVVPAFATTNATAPDGARAALDGVAVHCTTPEWLALPAAAGAHRLDQHRAPLALSLNGQQYYRTGLYFAYHPSPTLSRVLPAAGPASGGTRVRLSGARLDGGDKALFHELWVSQLEDVRTRAELACRFAARNGSLPLATVPATWQAAHERVLCATPAAGTAMADAAADATAPFDTRIALSLNGVDFASSHVEFSYMPVPVLTALSPASGPSLGGTEVTIDGTGLSPRIGLECGFEDAVAPATLDSDTVVRCVTPSIGHASPRRHGGVAYGMGELPLRGNATQLHSSIRLSSVADAHAGTIMIPIPRGTPELRDFEASWLYLLPAEAAAGTVGGGHGYAGGDSDAGDFARLPATSAHDARLAFRYGPLPTHPTPFGGEGALDGLSVSLSDGPPPLVVEVRYGGTTILSRAVGAPLPRGVWTRLRINCDAGVLNVYADARAVLRDLVVPGWTPTRGWHMGIGASGARPARYVAAMRLTSALILGLADVPVRLRMLGEQYAPSELNFTYTSVAVVSELSPASGPSSEPTQIVITGANFDLGLGVRCLLQQHGNSSTRAATLATNGTQAAINCTVPTSPWVAGDVNVYVSLDNGAYGPGSTFERYATPTLKRLSPTLGVGASTRVSIFGDGLTRGTDRRCRFGGMEVPAYVQPAGHLICTAPVNSIAGEVGVEVTLNGVQYVHDGNALAFKYLTSGMVFVSHVHPPLGPTVGSPNISVYGTNFVPLPEGLACAFGGNAVNATYISSGQLLCDAPPASSGAGSVLVEASLNLQEFYAGAQFYYAADGGLGRPAPSSKGRSGGKTLLVSLTPPVEPSTAELGAFVCRFGTAPCDGGGGGGDPTCVVVAATLVSAGVMRCVVPHSPLAPNPDPDVASTDVSLWASLNGRQFSYGPADFTYFEVDPEIRAIEPPIGPIRGATRVFVRGVGLHAGKVGEHGCRFSLMNDKGVFETGDLVPATPAADKSGLTCYTPQKALAMDAVVEITLNVADWVGNASHGVFTYTMSGAPSIVTPESGPRHGGTVLLFSMRPRPESHMQTSNGLALCRLGNGTTSGTFTAAGFLRCVAPPGPVEEVDVSTALNGQQFELGDAKYHYAYSLSDLMGETDPEIEATAEPPPPAAPPPNATAILEGLGGGGSVGSGGTGSGGTGSGPPPPPALVAAPLVGPTAGGTTVTLDAQFALDVATDLRCRFGPSSLTNCDVPATIQSTDPTIARCTSPAALTTYEAAAGTYPYTTSVPLALSLNGQQYLNIDTFTLYAPAVPSSSVPNEASMDGGTTLNVTGSFLGGGGGSVPRLCSFGAAIVPATHYDDSGDGSGAYLQCRTPSSDAAGPQKWFTLDFGDLSAMHKAISLHGDATLRGGSLRLVSRDTSWHGAFHRRCGAAVLSPLAGARSLPYFEARFDVLMAGATKLPGGSGVSFNYGAINDGEALDDRGTGHEGLVISLRGGVANVIEVRHKQRLVLAAPLGTSIRGLIWTPVVLRHTEKTFTHGGGLEVLVGGVVMVSGLQLDPHWFPQPHWKLALAACSVEARDASHEHWVHHLRVGAGSLLNISSVPVRVSLNGQQFEPEASVAPPLPLRLLTPPVASYMSPRLGRVSGGVTVQVFGSHFGHGSLPTCKFEDSGSVPATVVSTSSERGDEVRCVTPPTASARAIALRVSVNGAQYSDPPLWYTYHLDVGISAVSPSSGPELGGTTVRLLGTMQALSALLAHPMCRFEAGSVSVPLPATYASAHGNVLLCVTPPAAQLQLYAPYPANASLRASLNALDYSDRDPVHAGFLYVDTYRALDIAPDVGPADGNTSIAIRGTNISAGDGSYSELTCRLGIAHTPATLVAPDTLRCVAPPLGEAAGNYSHVAEGVVAPDGGSWELLGEARPHGAGHVLVDNEPHTAGGLLLAAASPTLHVLGANRAPPAFALSFQILVAGEGSAGGDGAGFSVSYGDLAAGALGEYGGGNGLRVSFRSRATPTDASNLTAANAAPHGDVLSVRLGPTLLLERWLGVGDPPLPSSGGPGYVPIGVEHEPSRGLAVSVRGERLIEGLTLPHWFPQAGWRFGIGARCDAEGAQYAVRQLQLTTGLLLSGGHLNLRVTLNGANYDNGGVRFHYYSVVTAAPTLGPAAGGTLVRLNGTELRHGLLPRLCRFGSTGVDGTELLVTASLVEGSQDLLCASPQIKDPGYNPAGLVLSLSLNRVDYLPILNFTFYADPQISSIYPASGASYGGTPITVSGVGLLAGSLAPRCRFGITHHHVDATEVPASFVPDLPSTLVCAAPPLAARVPVAVEVSLDGQYYTEQAVRYMPLERLGVAAVGPSSGPIKGGTYVQVHARGLRGATVLRCRFGNATVPAAWDAAAYGDDPAAAEAAGALTCTVPPYDDHGYDAPTLASLEASLNHSARVVDANGQVGPQPLWPGLPRGVPVEVSANGADFSSAASDADAVRFTYFQPMPSAGVTTLTPPMGPTRGGNLVMVRGLPTPGASRAGCRFGGYAVGGTVGAAADDDGIPDVIRCATPAFPPEHAGPVALELSLNGQQWVGTTSAYTYAPPTRVVSLLPDIAPNTGGLILELSGEHFGGGSGYRCRFGAPAATAATAVTVDATYDGASDTILCTSPEGLLGYVPVEVSLNAQQYSRHGPRLTVYDPDALETLLPGEGEAAETVAE